jgi:ATP-binding cassette subfamily C protein LapB
VLRGIGMWTEFQNIQLAQQRAGKFNELEVTTGVLSSQSGEITGSISLNNVGFEYPGSKQRSCLTGVSLQVRPGEFAGIKGEDGSGRSTLVKLITGEIKPTTGTVVIGGLESCPDREQLQVKDVAYVSASTATFRGTILENITMFRTGAAVEAAQHAAKLIGLEDEIHRLPDGYDTQLSQGVAQTLSSGLLQRISIARALARNPKILIFDEANTLLDFQSDAALRAGLESLKGAMTAIIISNRPSFLSIADRVYTLNDGTLEEQQCEAAPTATQVPMQGSAA